MNTLLTGDRKNRQVYTYVCKGYPCKYIYINARGTLVYASRAKPPAKNLVRGLVVLQPIIDDTIIVAAATTMN